MNKAQYQQQVVNFLEKAQLRITEEEKARIEIASFGLPDYPRSGLQLLTYCNNERYCAKELVLFPDQVCPEHRHPPFGSSIGKQETFRCRWGEVYLFVDDDSLTLNENESGEPICHKPEGDEQWYQCNRFILLKPGEQYTIKPNTLHWFKAGSMGAVVSEFSSESRDEFDIFTDPRVRRLEGIE
ncbi:D-lyxose/D-mannose family sugar isomerase [Providencia vermicola]|uniref:D-lyxose ketol-isomerase n=2 Tax=Providencia vermicola TaxID=333965 RepID=A0AAX3RVU5_9GAMM|nr:MULTISPECIES: D-lyxose/D-mannose family sugar isomerase [Providencia]ELR5045608.1 D-lyxose/D-mannose family sugar isomerase [Providencia rettgeri]ELR5046626.1 D-lyxose/D-mannose family sugar isomerase [Providencia rettgeri]ELR5291921.1 D-lyxose/D-mannose family sugar isomerase [Providencia stuartii]ELR5293990.1 D-lyxose/D-mannose family sugar isomerase [Providencia stuartii]ELX8379008.1 D-lyxose/D-mannose family sugar isomerase [Providencia stuartii]